MAENEFRFTDGAAYERFMGPWTRAVGSVFLDWLSIPAKQRWLDVGCGTGMFTELLVRPEGANYQWRRNPPRELSIDLVADERLSRVTSRAGAS